jgi:hypothetical protein
MSEEDQIAVISFDDTVRVDDNFSIDLALLENAICYGEVGSIQDNISCCERFLTMAPNHKLAQDARERLAGLTQTLSSKKAIIAYFWTTWEAKTSSRL